jgi:hypothetical protein
MQINAYVALRGHFDTNKDNNGRGRALDESAAFVTRGGKIRVLRAKPLALGHFFFLGRGPSGTLNVR